jgi:hypothetical protein
MPQPTILEQGLATLHVCWIPIALLFAPVAYLLLSYWNSKKSKTAGMLSSLGAFIPFGKAIQF